MIVLASILARLVWPRVQAFAFRMQFRMHVTL